MRHFPSTYGRKERKNIFLSPSHSFITVFFPLLSFFHNKHSLKDASSDLNGPRPDSGRTQPKRCRPLKQWLRTCGKHFIWKRNHRHKFNQEDDGAKKTGRQAECTDFWAQPCLKAENNGRERTEPTCSTLGESLKAGV